MTNDMANLTVCLILYTSKGKNTFQLNKILSRKKIKHFQLTGESKINEKNTKFQHHVFAPQNPNRSCDDKRNHCSTCVYNRMNCEFSRESPWL